MTRLLVVGLVAAALGAVVTWRVKPSPAPAFASVVVPDRVLEAARPALVPSVTTRILYRDRAPTQVATSAGTPDTAAIARFCGAAVARGQTSAGESSGNDPRADSSTAAPPARPTPLLLPSAGRYDGRTLELHATRSDGSLYLARYQLRPKFEWRASDTAFVVREQRPGFRFLPQLGNCAIAGGLGAGVGFLMGGEKAALAGGLAGCGATIAF